MRLLSHTYRVVLCCALPLLAAGRAVCAQTFWPHLFTARQGLQLPTRGQAFSIAFLGGSITEANGYRVQLEAFFQKQFPALKLRFVNAGVGGTGSDLAAFRLAEEVLSQAPHWVVVEFAVNDAGKDSLTVVRSLESIVRQLRQARPAVQPIFLYTLHQPMLEQYAQAVWPSSVRWAEQVAAYYLVPSVNLAGPVLAEWKNGGLIFKGSGTSTAPGKWVFTNDGTHPTEAGHRMYATAAWQAITQLLKTTSPSLRAPLPKPLVAANYRVPQRLPIAGHPGRRWPLATAATLPDTALLRRLPGLRVSESADSGLQFQFWGSLLGFEDVVGPASGSLVVTIDGKPAQRVVRFDKYSSSYRRSYFLLPPMPSGKHDVHLHLSRDALDKEAILGRPAEPSMLANRGFLYRVLTQ